MSEEPDLTLDGKNLNAECWVQCRDGDHPLDPSAYALVVLFKRDGTVTVDTPGGLVAGRASAELLISLGNSLNALADQEGDPPVSSELKDAAADITLGRRNESRG